MTKSIKLRDEDEWNLVIILKIKTPLTRNAGNYLLPQD